MDLLTSNLCSDLALQNKIASLGIINILELVGACLLATLMLALLCFIFFQLRFKNLWSDLQGVERKLLQSMYLICIISGLAYLAIFCIQIALFLSIKSGNQPDSHFDKLWSAYFSISLLIGFLMNNVLLITSYLWEHIIKGNVSMKKKTIMFVFFAVIWALVNLSVIIPLVLTLYYKKQSHLDLVFWYANTVVSCVCAGAAILFSLRFLNKLRQIGTSQQVVRKFGLNVIALIISAGVRISYNLYSAIQSTRVGYNYAGVDRDCIRIHWYFVFVNGIINLLRFFLPIFIISIMFASDKEKDRQNSLYDSFLREPQSGRLEAN